MTRRILGVDPGSAKVGLAVVEGRERAILMRAVVPCAEFEAQLTQADARFHPELIVIGNGTHSTKIQNAVRTALPGKAILIVDETDTTIRARERYWQHTPRRGWRRLLPSSLQVPPVPIDDFVAVILAERALQVE